MIKFLMVFALLCGCTHGVNSGATNQGFAPKCPITYVIAPKNYTLTDNDQVVKKSATERCKHHFPNNPCLKMFEVLSFQDYHATCGQP